ncbi:MAG: hypothetical protein C0599_02625 [Salinivirgaceae bacterium]|nr:MAG: hypothetical protein C0599_02625 [Salinivirgaceae bacterium]
MINNVVSLIIDRLNENLNNRFSQSSDIVISGTLNDLENDNNSVYQDKLILTLSNIEHERLAFSQNPRSYNTPINIYLYMLISANFQQSNYVQGLGMLSAVISFFQYYANWNHSNAPGLDTSVEKLSFELINLNIQELTQLWGVHGGKYVPSALYKVRTVRISEDIDEPGSLMGGFGAGVS